MHWAELDLRSFYLSVNKTHVLLVGDKNYNRSFLIVFRCSPGSFRLIESNNFGKYLWQKIQIVFAHSELKLFHFFKTFKGMKNFVYEVLFKSEFNGIKSLCLKPLAELNQIDSCLYEKWIRESMAACKNKIIHRKL